MNNWTKEELKETVVEYKKLQLAIARNEKVLKSDIYNRLSEKYGRTPKSYGRRFSNISYVLTLSGREWIKGLKPLSNVGSNVIREIEEILAEIESRTIQNIAIPLRVKQKPPAGNKFPAKNMTQMTYFERDQQVVDWVKMNAKGKCELCSKSSPFHDSLNIPYMEVHHVKQLAEGGSDTIYNAVALCPNCHREMHYGMNYIERKKQLYKMVRRLIPE
jgi:5-methylcytosine-specific restriction protein A